MGLGQNFTPTISAENPGAYGCDPFSPRQTIEHHLHYRKSDMGVVYMTDMTDMTYKRGLDRRLKSSSETYHPPSMPLLPIAALLVNSRVSERSHEMLGQ